jgi:tetratricopeptide (TPR) repeat protein
LGNLGNAYLNLGEIKRAIGYCKQAIAIRREIGDINGIAIDSVNMALLYSDQGEVSQALSLAQEAAQIWSQIGSPNLQAARQLIADLQGK